jgi:hypothetical protein
MRRLKSVLMVGALAAAAITVTPGSAQAAPRCSVKAGSGRACVAVDNSADSSVRSIRVNGRCVQFRTTSRYLYAPTAIVQATGFPSTQTYSGGSCQSGTQNTPVLFWDSSPNRENYRYVHIRRRNSGGCGIC